MSIQVREACEHDVDAIGSVFQACYGDAYPYPQYYDTTSLKRMVFGDDTCLLVAESEGRVLGTASVVMEISGRGDFVGEFGRLAVHPDARNLGLGKALMEGRLKRVEDRLHVGIVEPRAKHPFSQKISARHGFSPVGFLPLKHRYQKRESVCLFARLLGSAQELRRNHPRVIPEAYHLADVALRGVGLACDVVVDDTAASHAATGAYELEAMTQRLYAPLLHVERGRVSHRAIFGPVHLHYGLFKLRAEHATYLVARDRGRVAGALGVMFDPGEQSVKFFELIAPDDRPTRFLLESAIRQARETWKAQYIEVDVSAYEPAMQRTLLELGFLPAAYIPALGFDRIERLDAIRMVRLEVPLDRSDIQLIDVVLPIADSVMDAFEKRSISPRLLAGLSAHALARGLNTEQVAALARIVSLRSFEAGQPVMRHGDPEDAGTGWLVISGDLSVCAEGKTLACAGSGSCVGEMAMMTGETHRADAIAIGSVEAAALSHEALAQLTRQRPDIGVVVYRNLAIGLRQKLGAMSSDTISP